MSLEECEVAVAFPVRHCARELLPFAALVGKVAAEHGVAEHLACERVGRERVACLAQIAWQEGYARALDPDMLAKGLGMNDAK